MTVPVIRISNEELDRLGATHAAEKTGPHRVGPEPEAGTGTLSTERGNLPLDRLDVRAEVTGLTARTVLRQGFRNPYDEPLEATYIFPLPDRAAVTAMRMEMTDRTVEGRLEERGKARQRYDEAVAAGQRASIAEEERPDVFTMRVGNISPGERVSVRLTLDGPLPYEDDAATYRFPLVVAPRYIPGYALPGGSVGSGTIPDTDAVPDASRITPPVLLPGFPNPVDLSIEVDIDPAGLPLTEVRSSLHAVTTEDTAAGTHLAVTPGERVNRDFILRLGYGDEQAATSALTVIADGSADTPTADGDRFGAGTFRLTVLPPTLAATSKPRDVVLLLDRSGSMSGWKMVAARRAAARIVDTLTDADRFAVLLFDSVVERPTGLPEGLTPASDRHRYRAVEALARTEARGGTELLKPLTDGAGLLTDETRDRVLVLVTDGQVGNEDQIMARTADPLRRIRVHTVGIDQAVNAGFLGRLATVGGGRCELVESEDRLDEAMAHIHRRISAPVITSLRLSAEGLDIVDDSLAPSRLPDLFAGAPLVVAGRYRGDARGGLALRGVRPDGEPWTARIAAIPAKGPTAAAVWARAHLRDLTDRYAAGGEDREQLERRIVATSLRFGVLCRFTAFVAVDTRVVTDGTAPHQVIQPVELPAGWEPPVPAGGAGGMVPMAMHTRSAGVSGARAAHRAGFGGPQAAPQGFVPGPGVAAPGRLPSPGRAGRATLETARSQVADELRRLREARAVTPADRLALLGDLGSRLSVLVERLGTGESAARSLEDLVRELRACDGPEPPRGADLDRLWQRTVDVLAGLAGTGDAPAPPATGDAPPPRRTRRGPFWK